MTSTLVVVVDPGHGGTDPGAVWPTRAELKNASVIEKDTNLDVSLELRAMLDCSEWPVACELTREDDVDVSLQSRGAVSEKLGADLVISIHTNASGDAARGMLCFVRRDDHVADSVARAILAAAPLELRRKVAEPIVTNAADWTSRAHNVLSVHSAPAVLVEIGFLTSENDRRVLLSESGRSAIVSAILCGIARYRQIHEAAVNAA